MKRIGLALTAATLLPLAAVAQDSDRTWNWSGNVGSGRWVNVISVNGPITVEPSADGRVHVTAERRGRGDPREVRLDVVEHDGNVTVCALWHRESRCEPGGIRGGSSRRGDRNNDVQVHFTVRLPAQAHVATTTVNGGIKVAGARNEIKATTVNGGIEVGSSGGPVSATTVNGSIRASMGSVGQSGLKFTTVNGGIDVAMPRESSADVKLSTVNGSITTEFPITIEGRWGPRSANGRIGSGGTSLEMSSVNGSLALRAL